MIIKHNKAFGNGTLNDLDTMALINGTEGLKISRNTYYKYKRELDLKPDTFYRRVKAYEQNK